MRTLLVTLTATVLLAGCAGQRPLVIDRKGVDPGQYQRDLAECQGYAAEARSGRLAAGGALGGAVVGGAVGAIVGDHNTAERAAGAGAVSGLARGSRAAQREQRAIVRNCLTGRGYKVLN